MKREDPGYLHCVSQAAPALTELLADSAPADDPFGDVLTKVGGS